MKMILAIAWRNLWRNTRRSVLSILAITFSVILLLFMMCWQQGSYTDMIRNAVNVHTGYLQIQQQGYLENNDLEKALHHVDRVQKLIAATDHVTVQTPRINAPALVSFGIHTSGALVFGVDPDKEAKFSTIAKVIKQGAYLDENDRDGALIGETLAKNLQVGLGDRIALMGQGADGSMAAGLLTIRGIYKTYMPDLDKSSLFAHIDTIGDLFSMYGGVHEVAVMIDDLHNLETVQAALTAGIAREKLNGAVALTWDQVLPGVKQGIEMDWKSGQIMYMVLMMIVGFGIMNTFLMAFLERTREFGVMMSIGMRPGQLSRLIFLEAMMLTFVGLIAGLALGSALTYYFQIKGIYFASMEEIMREVGMSPIMYPELSWWLIGRTSAFILVISGVVALYPAIKVTGLRPVEALRSI